MAKEKKSLLSRLRPRFPRYVRESYRELRKVTWPSRRESWKLTFAVILFTAAFTAFAVIADTIFDILAEEIFL
ncbi:MAG: preprotein translocase subunit SecE [Candidatus Saccharimonadales bacterium]|nr:preprotein translocase subunit SecE [Candidatus Saccharimonadales bacterium]